MKIIIGREVCIGRWIWSEEKKEQKRVEPKICPICTSEIREGMATITCPYCGAVGHLTCIDSWLKIRDTCPICKRPMVGIVT